MTAEEKAKQDAQDTHDARAFAIATHNSRFDVMVDGINRLIRPGVTLWLVGGFADFWKLPEPQKIDPFWLQCFLIVVTFWFGGRVLLKDLPQAVLSILSVVNQLKRK